MSEIEACKPVAEADRRLWRMSYHVGTGTWRLKASKIAVLRDLAEPRLFLEASLSGLEGSVRYHEGMPSIYHFQVEDLALKNLLKSQKHDYVIMPLRVATADSHKASGWFHVSPRSI